MTATTLRLYGQMGAKFGRVHHVHLDTNTPAEAMRYLCSQFPKARAYLTQAKDRGVGFAVFRGKENLDEDQLNEPVGKDDIRIAPIILGSKNGGVFNVILGAVLIVVGYLGMTIGAAYGGDAWGPPLIKIGAAMVAGGIIQMLTPVPRAPSNADSPDNKPSYIFSGAVNTQAQGNPVPLLYGRMIVGSAVVSAGINTEFYQPTQRVGRGNPKLIGRDDPILGWNPHTPYESY